MVGEADMAGSCLQRHNASNYFSFFSPCFSGHTCSIKQKGSWSHFTSPLRGATSTWETTQNTDKEYSYCTLAPPTKGAHSTAEPHACKGSDLSSRRLIERRWCHIWLLRKSKEKPRHETPDPEESLEHLTPITMFVFIYTG